MKTTDEIRREQLRAIVRDIGGVPRLADKIGKSEAQIRQWTNASKSSTTGRPRAISSDIARIIEECLGKEIGWMDNDPELAVVPGWSELDDMQRAQVIGFVAALLSQQPPHTQPFIENNDQPSTLKKAS